MHEIYDSIQGESTLAGMACTFVRLAGCPLRCSYCDTVEAQATDSGEWMSIDEVVSQVASRKRPLVLVTGGEPLAQRHCVVLLENLLALDCELQLETSGAFPIAEVPKGVHRILDVKTPESGESARNRLENFASLREGDELKFVISSRADYEWSREFLRAHALDEKGVPILFSPAWGRLSLVEMSQWLLEDRLPVRLQLQLHKIIWGAEAKGV